MDLHSLSLVRKEMCDEVDQDIRDGKLYISSRLNEGGKQEWQKLLRLACELHDAQWLADVIKDKNLLNETELRQGKLIRMRSDAASSFSYDEFNRFYCRGVCLHACNKGFKYVEVYRASLVKEPRPESKSKIGKKINPEELLLDLRENIGKDTKLGVPGGPNSGIIIKIP